jgi:cell division septation protein DedD
MSSDQDRNEPRFEPNLDTIDVRYSEATVPDQPPPRSGRKKLLGAVVAIAALSGFAGVAWYATTQGQKNPGAVVPVIAADSSPIKERPTDPGGLEVPNQGMQVFSQITPTQEPQKIERLLPPAETPVARPAPESTPPAGPLVPNAPAIKERAEVAAATPPPTAKPVPAAPAPVKEAKIVLPKVPAPKPTTAVAGRWQVQLGAVREKARAEAAAKRLASSQKALLGDMKIGIVRADLGTRGVYYRLRAGPLKDRAAADALCRKLAGRKVGCIVVKP